MAGKAINLACGECQCQRFRENRRYVRQWRRESSRFNARMLELEVGQSVGWSPPDMLSDHGIPCKDCGHARAEHRREQSETLGDYAQRIAGIAAESRQRENDERAKREEKWNRKPRWLRALLSWSLTDPLLKIGGVVVINWTVIICGPLAVLAYDYGSAHNKGGPSWLPVLLAGIIFAFSSPLVQRLVRFLFAAAGVVFGLAAVAGTVFVLGVFMHWWA